MKRRSGWALTGIGVLLVGAAANQIWAQGVVRPGAVAPAAPAAPGVVTPPGENKKVLSIRRMPRLNKVKQPTPSYNTSATRTAPGRARDWAVFDVVYDSIPEWLDEVVVTYYLMSEHRGSDAKKEYSFYQTTVRYVDVPRGEHMACVVLPPGPLLRYGDQFIGMAVEITAADGTLLASKDEVQGWTPPAGDWWKKPEVTESKSVVKRDGLVDRSKTPFGLINIDEYEVVK